MATTASKPRKPFTIREAKLSGAFVKQINNLADRIAEMPANEFPSAPDLVRRLRDFSVDPTAPASESDGEKRGG